MRKQLILGLALVLVLSGCSALNQDQGQKDQENQDILTTEEAKTKAKKFIDNNLLAAGQSGSEITNVTEEKGLYKMKVKVGNQSIDSYMTKDGSKFFPQVVDMDKSAQESNNNSNNQQQQQQQQQTSIKDQANAMVQQGNMLLQE